MNREIRNLLVVYDNYGVLNIPIRFINALKYEKGQLLYIILDNEQLTIIDEDNFYRINTTQGMKIYRTRLTVNDNKGKGSFRIIINSKLVELLHLEKNNTVSIDLDVNKLIINKYDEMQRPMSEGENVKQEIEQRQEVRNM